MAKHTKLSGSCMREQQRWQPAQKKRRAAATLTLWILGAMFLFTSLPLSYTYAAETEASSEKPAYKFGAFPMVAVGQIGTMFAPVATEFTQVLGQSVQFRTRPSFLEFRQGLSREIYDFAVVQPFDYVLAYDRYHYLPLARFDKPLTANILVLPESTLHSLQDLKGKKVALPPTTAAVTLMAKKAMLEAGLDLKRDVSLQYTKTHDACLELVIVKSADACVSAPRAAYYFETKWGKHFRLLHQTPGIPNVLFIVHRRVPKQVRELLLKTLTSWPESSEVGRDFIKLNNNLRLIPAMNAEYDIIRKFPQNLEEE